MKIVVGLGNPGRRFIGTRHNLGFEVVDYLAQSPSCLTFRERFGSLAAESTEGDQQLLLVKPQSFMNLSGLAVRQFVDFYQLPLADLLVVCDDFNLPLGTLRMRRGGSSGGHNGLRDIEAHLGTTDFPRLRLGVEDPAAGRAIEHVLGRFQPGDRAAVEDMTAHAARAVLDWVQRGIDFCMNQYNG